MKKFIALTAGALLALPAIASAQITGECSGCHTMHNSEQGKAVAEIGNSGVKTNAGIQNLLKFDCVGCHAADPAGPNTITLAETAVPQVLHGNGAINEVATSDLAGGNFAYGLSGNAGGNRNVHNVKDINWVYAIDQVGAEALSGPPGIYGQDNLRYHAGRWSVETPFDEFTCAGARGCHGTRSQLLTGHTAAADTSQTETQEATYVGVMRTGIAAVTGAHHLNTGGAKTSVGYTGPSVHDGAVVAAGYRFIPGLKGFEIGDYINTNNSHNEYYGVEAGFGTSCGACHIEQSLHGVPADYENTDPTTGEITSTLTGDENWGMGSRMGLDSTITVPNNSMSGFCSTCHGNFHSSGAAGDSAKGTWTDTPGDDPSTVDIVETTYKDGIMDTYTVAATDGDYQNNGVSGAFLRHPSDYTIPNRGDYALYTAYDVTAPVARTTVLQASDATVSPGDDLVMCLSCHLPHGSKHDYLLRFDYSADTGKMEAGKQATINDSIAQGGCLACHSAKGVSSETALPLFQ